MADDRQPSELQRIEAFEEAHARAQATSVVELAWGYALLQSDFPRTHSHNRVVVTSRAHADEIMETTDAILGGAGVQHRYVTVIDDATGSAMVPDLVAAGFAHDPIATMVYRGPSMPPAPEHEVGEMTAPELREAIISDWRHDMPDADEEVYEQLADRTRLYSQGADVVDLGVVVAGEVAARANLFLSTDSQIAQFENLNTSHGHRNNGYARSVLRAALGRVAAATCELCFLTADVGDWPYEWYRRLGFVEVARTHHFTRSSA